MSVFPRIDPDHPLTRAAREVNEWAVDGLEGALEHAGIDVSVGELAYLAEQRALRAVAANAGMLMGNDAETDERVAQAIVLDAAMAGHADAPNRLLHGRHNPRVPRAHAPENRARIL